MKNLNMLRLYSIILYFILALSLLFVIVVGRRRAGALKCIMRVIVIGKGKGIGFNHKIIIKVRSHHLVLWLLGTLWSARFWVRD
jgi:hypothetical protein